MRGYPRQAWKAAVACICLSLVNPIVMPMLSTYVVDPLSKDFGISASGVLTALNVPVFLSPAILPIAGRLIDRRGIRAITIPAAVAYGIAMALVGILSTNTVQLALLLVLATAGGYMTSQAVVFKVVVEWFPRHRGMALGAINGVSGLTAAALSPVMALLVTNFGWRAPYLLLAAIILLVALPGAIFLLSEPADADRARQSREPAGRPTKPQRPDLPGLTVGQAIRTRTWLFLVVVVMIVAGAEYSVQQNAVSIFGEHGYTVLDVSFALAAGSIASLAALLGSGFYLDRIKTSRMAIAPFAAAILIALVLTQISQGAFWLLMLVFLFLFVTGGINVAGPYLTSRMFGLRSFAQLQGITLWIVTLVASLTPILFRTGAERTGTYTVPLLALTVAAAAGFVLAIFLPRFPQRDPNLEGFPEAGSGSLPVPDRTGPRGTDQLTNP